MDLSVKESLLGQANCAAQPTAIVLTSRKRCIKEAAPSWMICRVAMSSRVRPLFSVTGKREMSQMRLERTAKDLHPVIHHAAARIESLLPSPAVERSNP
jgi:hypothetical protein